MSLAMRMIGFALACVVCASRGRRLRSDELALGDSWTSLRIADVDEESKVADAAGRRPSFADVNQTHWRSVDTSAPYPLEMLGRLLVAFSPTDAFRTSGLAARCPGSKLHITGSHHLVLDGHTCRPVVIMSDRGEYKELKAQYDEVKDFLDDKQRKDLEDNLEEIKTMESKVLIVDEDEEFEDEEFEDEDEDEEFEDEDEEFEDEEFEDEDEEGEEEEEEEEEEDQEVAAEEEAVLVEEKMEKEEKEEKDKKEKKEEKERQEVKESMPVMAEEKKEVMPVMAEEEKEEEEVEEQAQRQAEEAEAQQKAEEEEALSDAEAEAVLKEFEEARLQAEAELEAEQRAREEEEAAKKEIKEVDVKDVSAFFEERAQQDRDNPEMRIAEPAPNPIGDFLSSLFSKGPSDDAPEQAVADEVTEVAEERLQQEELPAEDFVPAQELPAEDFVPAEEPQAEQLEEPLIETFEEEEEIEKESPVAQFFQTKAEALSDAVGSAVENAVTGAISSVNSAVGEARAYPGRVLEQARENVVGGIKGTVTDAQDKVKVAQQKREELKKRLQ